MREEKLKKIVTSFIESERIENYFYSGVLDVETIGEVISLIATTFYFNNVESARYFEDASILKQAYLERIPEEGMFFENECLEVMTIISMFYQHLFETKVISKNAYTDALHVIYDNHQLFIEKMLDEDNWSESKIELLDAEDEIMENMSELMSPLLQQFENQLLGKVGGMKKDFPSKNNIIPVNFDNSRKKPSPVKVYQLRIDLNGFKPPIWRRILVQSGTTYDELHGIIQTAFQWEGSHLHGFETRYGRVLVDNGDDYFSEVFGIESSSPDITVIDEVLEVEKKMSYTYDYGDNWGHTIKLEKIFSLEDIEVPSLPWCLKVVGATPIEDFCWDEEEDDVEDDETIGFHDVITAEIINDWLSL